MDPETALQLVKHGATILLLDVPQYTLIGIDTQMFSVGPSFKGIKMIPPGPHFLYYSSSSREGREFSPITGFFVDAGSSEVIVRKWDQREERLVKVSEEEEQRFGEAVRKLEFDRQLEPIGGDISVACEPGISQSTSKSAIEKVLDDQLKASKFAMHVDSSQRRKCYYTEIPHVIKQRGVHGQELTNLNLDKTLLLEKLLKKDFGGSEDLLLGELQFAFVVFLMGQSLEGFLQWKSLVSLFFECTEAPFCTRSQLFTKFIKVLYHQLKFGLEKDHSNDTGRTSTILDESWFSADSFLYHLCKDFFSLVLEAPVVDGDLLTWTRKLKELLENSLDWKFQNNAASDGISFDEDDEYIAKKEESCSSRSKHN
ncbi:Protein AAR2-like protein [Cucurbita argyrosperma subsp. argyrosperma]|nr:Protein AAR2-like protein [Cucurbita argyrosperma subsp. argyrosperma]